MNNVVAASAGIAVAPVAPAVVAPVAEAAVALGAVAGNVILFVPAGGGACAGVGGNVAGTRAIGFLHHVRAFGELRVGVHIGHNLLHNALPDNRSRIGVVLDFLHSLGIAEPYDAKIFGSHSDEPKVGVVGSGTGFARGFNAIGGKVRMGTRSVRAACDALAELVKNRGGFCGNNTDFANGRRNLL